MADINDLDKRVAVIESEFKNLKENFEQMKDSSQETFKLVFSMKERIDKQNGLIPHMAEKVKEISERVDTMNENLNLYMSSRAKYLENIKNSPRVSAAKWAAFGAVVTTVIGGIVQLIRVLMAR